MLRNENYLAGDAGNVLWRIYISPRLKFITLLGVDITNYINILKRPKIEKIKNKNKNLKRSEIQTSVLKFITLLGMDYTNYINILKRPRRDKIKSLKRLEIQTSVLCLSTIV